MECLSVLKKSHVVSKSGQLLFVWNQRDRGRIWREGKAEQKHERRGDSFKSSTICSITHRHTNVNKDVPQNKHMNMCERETVTDATAQERKMSWQLLN